MGSDWVYRREYRSVEDDLDAVAAVTVADLAAVLAKYRLDCSTTITIGAAGGSRDQPLAKQ